MLKALHAYQHEYVSNLELAARGLPHRDRRPRRAGRQAGPVHRRRSAASPRSSSTPTSTVEVDAGRARPADVRDRLEENLLLFFTGVRRSAVGGALATRTGARAPTPPTSDENLDAVRALGDETLRGARGRRPRTRFGELLTEQWQLKSTASPTPVHARGRRDGSATGIAAGAGGGKLVGAGGGGFLLFYAEEKAELRDAMARARLEEVRFGFDHEGTSTVVT